MPLYPVPDGALSERFSFGTLRPLLPERPPATWTEDVIFMRTSSKKVRVAMVSLWLLTGMLAMSTPSLAATECGTGSNNCGEVTANVDAVCFTQSDGDKICDVSSDGSVRAFD